MTLFYFIFMIILGKNVLTGAVASKGHVASCQEYVS